jgi:uncharacterized protein YjbJ (UPF0337 family)
MGSTTREEAGHVQEKVGEAAGDVLETAKEQASDVASDVQEQTRRLIGETRDQLGQQAVQQRDQAVQGLRSVGDELRTMAEHGSGWGAQLARHGAGWSDRAAGFLDGRDLADVLDDVRSMARRRPGRFLLGAAVAGVVVGRLSRAMAAGAPDRSGSNGSTGSTGGMQYAGTGSSGLSYPDATPYDGTTSAGMPGVDVPPGPRTGQDGLHQPLAAGTATGAEAADPTYAGDALTGQPTIEPPPPPLDDRPLTDRRPGER